MALSDLAVYSEYTYTTMVEVVDQMIELFNAASDNCLQLQSAKHVGPYSDKVFWSKTAGLIRRRNPAGTGAVTPKVLAQNVETMVKVASGTPPVVLDPAQFRWLQINPEEAGVALGQQLAGDMLQEMVNTTIGAVNAAISGNPTLQYDISAFTDSGTSGAPINTMLASPLALSNTAAKFGDRGMSIAAWIMHSKVLYDMYANALTNHERLFQYGNVFVSRDPFGRRYIASDIPELQIVGTPNKYHTLGLVSGAVRCDQNDDYDQNVLTTNGNENLNRTFQAEWSYELGMKGYSWDKSTGGPAPVDAALFSAQNWQQVATSMKDTAGVMLISQ